MTEDELTKKEMLLNQKEVALNIRERDLTIYEGRIRREFEKLFPNLEFNLRDICLILPKDQELELAEN